METDELRLHASDLIDRAVGGRRGVEIADAPPPADAEVLTVTEGNADPERLRRQLAWASDAAAAGTPVVLYLANRLAAPPGAGSTAAELRSLFAAATDLTLLEQHRLDASLAGSGEADGERPVALAAPRRRPVRLLVFANLTVETTAEASLGPASEERARLERRLAELEERNLALARGRLGTGLDEGIRTRARRAERRLLFSRVREMVNALLARRRLRG